MEYDNSQMPIKGHDNFLKTEVEPEMMSNPPKLGDVAAEVCRLYKEFSDARQELESDWLDCWAQYFGNPRSQEHLRLDAARIIGDINDDWRHKISTGKAYENVETICGYLQSAFFPNKNWFRLIPTEPGYAELVKPVEHYLQQKLRTNRLISHWDTFIRQAVILGTSALALPWRVETGKTTRRVKTTKPVFDNMGVLLGNEDKFDIRTEEKVIFNDPDFEVLDMFDFFLDPKGINPNDTNVLRRMRKTKAEVLNLIDSGLYGYGSKHSVAQAPSIEAGEPESHKRVVEMFAGLQYTPTDLVEVLEYWGDITVCGTTYHNVVITVTGSQVLRFETNQYWYGKPFVVASYVPVTRQVYGIGALGPTLGLLHEMDILTNQRLDNLEFAVDQMWTFVPDGTIRKEDIFSKPGKVFEVSDHDAIRPVPRADVSKLTITYQETQYLETRIDKTTGTGAFIGAGAGRSGERVTATEVQAQRDAGGNRLAARHAHLEETVLVPMLNKLYKGCQQFTTHDTITRLPSPDPGMHLYANVGPHELIHDFQFQAQGATYIADKEFELQKWLNFIQTVGGNPALAPQINWPLVLEKLVVKFGLDDAESLILPPPPPPAPPEAPPAPPPDPLTEQLMGMGGQSMVDTFRAKSSTGQLPQMLSNINNDLNMGGRGTPENPEALAQIENLLAQQQQVVPQ